MTRPRTSWGWDAARATLDRITHEARRWSNGTVTASCGVPCGKAEVLDVSILTVGMQEVDCMACIAVTVEQ
jgi:hypothetical protein